LSADAASSPERPHTYETKENDMSVISLNATATTPSPRAVPLWRTGGLAAVAAALATTAVAFLATSAGMSLDIGGEPVPLFAFTQLTLACAVIGIVLAMVLRRRAAAPRRTFVVVTAVLTLLSLVPDLVAPAAPSTKAVLMAAHLVAAVIVIPLVAARLPARTR
jgi:predicted membrane channel-forming protein YqfA (hemolysin III family)